MRTTCYLKKSTILIADLSFYAMEWGGHGHGEIASQTVADAVFGFLKNLGKEKYEAQDLQDALDAALSTLTAADIYNDKNQWGLHWLLLS